MEYAAENHLSASAFIMKSEDYISQDAVTGLAWEKPISKKHTIAIATTVVLCLSMALVMQHQTRDRKAAEAQSIALTAIEPETSVKSIIDPTVPLTDLFAQTREDAVVPADNIVSPEDKANVMVVPNGQAMDNYDDDITDAELADSDEEMDEKIRVLASKVEQDQSAVISSKWFVQDVQKGDSVFSLFSNLNIPDSVTMAILENKEVAKEISTVHLGDHISFLLDDNSRLLAFIKPIDKDRQLHFFRSDVNANAFSYVIEPTNKHLEDGDVAVPADVTSGKVIAMNPQTPKEAVAAAQKEMAAAAAPQSAVAEATQSAAVSTEDKADGKTVAAAEPPKAETKKSPFETRGRLVVVTIDKGESFSSASNRAGVTYGEINQITKLFKGRIQFSRNIRAGDTMRVLYSDAKGKGKIQAVEFNLSKGGKVASYLNPSDGKYYDENGMNADRGTFRRFPLDGKIRISSNFNPGRVHPVLGYARPHNGTDFAVPVGTRVVAPADGVVDKTGYSRGSGYYIVIRHRGAYSTVYMHLSKIQVKQGQRVKMGATIARSGNTGMSTGPHLHYELRINGRPVNAMRVNLGKAAEAQVDGKARQKFTASVKKYKQELYNEKLTAMR